MLGKEEPAAIMFVDFSMRAALWWGACSGPVRLWIPTLCVGSEIARKTQPPRPDGRISRLVGGRKRAKRVCAQCAHPGLRIRPYRCRTGPDCGGSRGSGRYSRAGTRFESYLGHVFSLFRGLVALDRWERTEVLPYQSLAVRQRIFASAHGYESCFRHR